MLLVDDDGIRGWTASGGDIMTGLGNESDWSEPGQGGALVAVVGDRRVLGFAAQGASAHIGVTLRIDVRLRVQVVLEL